MLLNSAFKLPNRAEPAKLTSAEVPLLFASASTKPPPNNAAISAGLRGGLLVSSILLVIWLARPYFCRNSNSV